MHICIFTKVDDKTQESLILSVSKNIPTNTMPTSYYACAIKLACILTTQHGLTVQFGLPIANNKSVLFLQSGSEGNWLHMTGNVQLLIKNPSNLIDIYSHLLIYFPTGL